ncbi:hypothetical protein [Desulfurobacterium sp.]
MAFIETLLILVYTLVGLYFLTFSMKVVYGVFVVSGFFFLRFSLCPSCPLYGRGCTVKWDRVGRLLRIKRKSRSFFFPYTKVATVYWAFFFLFPLILVPEKESVFLFILFPLFIVQVLRCKTCAAGDSCFFGGFVGSRKKH